MSVREFNGTSDFLAVGGGALGAICNGAYSIICITRPVSVAQAGRAFVGIQVGISSILGSLADGGGTGKLADYTDSPFDDVEAGMTAATWQILGLSKASGTTNVRFHRKALGSGSWTHSTGATGTIPNDADACTRVEFASLEEGAFSSFKACRIASVGIYAANLSDANFESVQTTPATQTLFDLGAVALWDFNQANVATDVLDLTPGGANEVEISGTTVIEGADPPGWTFGITSAGNLAWVRA